MAGDLTARARIRDAAIEIFGRNGFATGVRTIATAATVSPALINHHFGSKEGLRSACDEYVLWVVRESKSATLASSPAAMMAQLAAIDRYAPVVAYIVKSFAAGGQLANEMFENMVEDTVAYLSEGVASGKLRPSRDPKARARFLMRQSIGGMLLYIQMQPPNTDFATALSQLTAEITLPALELYTEGIFADADALNAFLDLQDES